MYGWAGWESWQAPEFYKPNVSTKVPECLDLAAMRTAWESDAALRAAVRAKCPPRRPWIERMIESEAKG
jgi:hypothetical protein